MEGTVQPKDVSSLIQFGYITPEQHSSYEQYVGAKIDEIKRMHKEAVNAKMNREELWNKLSDPP